VPSRGQPSSRTRRFLRLLLNGKADTAETRRRCPRCGGQLEPNSSGRGDSVIFAASPAEELCVRCLTGHSSDWVGDPSPLTPLGRLALKHKTIRRIFHPD
jgi:uncharacterized protein with PIN domain